MNDDTTNTGISETTDAGGGAVIDGPVGADVLTDRSRADGSTGGLMGAPRLPLQRMSSDAARACVRLAREGGQCRVTLSPAEGSQASPVTWRLSLSPGPSDAVRHSASLHAILDWGGGRVRVGLPPTLCDAWLGARLPGLDTSGMSQSLRRAALRTMVQDVAAALDGKRASAAIRVLAIESPQQPSADSARTGPHSWTLQVAVESESDSDGGYLATLDADDLALTRLAALLPPSTNLPVRDNGVVAAGLPVRVLALIGQTVLPAADLRGLQPGDIVLVDEDFGVRAGVILLSTLDGQGMRMRRATREGAEFFTASSTWMKLMTNAEPEFYEGEGYPTTSASSGGGGGGGDDGHGDGEPETSLVTASIPLRVTFDAGECTMTLAELQRLQPGEVVNLDVPAENGMLRIRVNGKQIGAGELVDVDGRVGVRILRLGEAP